MHKRTAECEYEHTRGPSAVHRRPCVRRAAGQGEQVQVTFYVSALRGSATSSQVLDEAWLSERVIEQAIRHCTFEYGIGNEIKQRWTGRGLYIIKSIE